MFIGRVVGDVVSTVKHGALGEKKLLVVERLELDGEGTGKTVLAFDTVGAGAGDRVLVVDEGNSASQVLGMPRGPIRTLIVGVVDSVDIERPAAPPRRRAGEER
jgi:ethanolamine utilization protein EutN